MGPSTPISLPGPAAPIPRGGPRYAEVVDRAFDRVTRFGVPVLAMLTALGGLFGTLSANGFAVQHACVPAAGPLGLLGSDFALVRQVPGCPAARIATDGVVTVILVLALPVLMAQIAALALAVMASAALRSVARRVIGAVAIVLGAVFALVTARHVVVPPPAVRRGVHRWSIGVQRSQYIDGPRGIRGPPVAAAY